MLRQQQQQDLDARNRTAANDEQQRQQDLFEYPASNDIVGYTNAAGDAAADTLDSAAAAVVATDPNDAGETMAAEHVHCGLTQWELLADAIQATPVTRFIEHPPLNNNGTSDGILEI